MRLFNPQPNPHCISLGCPEGMIYNYDSCQCEEKQISLPLPPIQPAPPAPAPGGSYQAPQAAPMRTRATPMAARQQPQAAPMRMRATPMAARQQRRALSGQVATPERVRRNPGVGPLLLSLHAVTDAQSYPNLWGTPSPAPMVGVPGPRLPNPQAFEATGYYPRIYNPTLSAGRRMPNQTDVWWGGGGIAPWSWRPRSAPAVGISPTVGPAPWGAFQYQGGFWPWNGTAPYPGRYNNPERVPSGTAKLRFTIQNPGTVYVPSRAAGPQLPTGQWMRPAYNPAHNATLLFPYFQVQGRPRAPKFRNPPLGPGKVFCSQWCDAKGVCKMRCRDLEAAQQAQGVQAPPGTAAPRRAAAAVRSAPARATALSGAPKFRNRNRGVAQARARLSNPPPIFPGPGAHSQFAPLPPQWFYYTSPSTAGAPQAPGIQVAAPGPPPGVFGQGGRCYNDRDCREDEYCHGGICLPKPWSGQQQGIIQPNPGRQVGAQEWAMGLAPNPADDWLLTFPTKRAFAGRPSRRRNPDGMVSMTQPLAPGFQLR